MMLPISAVVDELELEAIEVGLYAVDQRGARPLTHHAGMDDGARGVRAFEHDLVDAAHYLDSLVGDEVAANRANQPVTVVAARVAVAGADRVAEEPGIALLGRLLRRGQQRADLGFRIAGSTARDEHGGESGSDGRRLHGRDCRGPMAAKTRRRTARRTFILEHSLCRSAVCAVSRLVGSP